MRAHLIHTQAPTRPRSLTHTLYVVLVLVPVPVLVVVVVVVVVVFVVYVRISTICYDQAVSSTSACATTITSLTPPLKSILAR